MKKLKIRNDKNLDLIYFNTFYLLLSFPYLFITALKYKLDILTSCCGYTTD